MMTGQRTPESLFCSRRIWEFIFQNELQSHLQKTHSNEMAANQQGGAAVDGYAIAEDTLVQR